MTCNYEKYSKKKNPDQKCAQNTSLRWSDSFKRPALPTSIKPTTLLLDVPQTLKSGRMKSGAAHL
jgi:hypothetical protein